MCRNILSSSVPIHYTIIFLYTINNNYNMVSYHGRIIFFLLLLLLLDKYRAELHTHLHTILQLLII